MCDFNHGERQFDNFSDKTDLLSCQERRFKRPIAKYVHVVKVLFKLMLSFLCFILSETYQVTLDNP